MYKPAEIRGANGFRRLFPSTRGGDNKSIAGELYLAPETVRNYTRSARMKLGARSRSHAIALAISSGQIQV